MWIEIDEDQHLPSIDSYWDEAIVLSLEILYAVEFGHSFERAVEAVVPSVVGTMQDRRLSAGFGHYCGGVVTAHVVEGAQRSVIAAHCDKRLAGYGCGQELPGLFNLVDAAEHLPRLTEDRLVL